MALWQRLEGVLQVRGYTLFLTLFNNFRVPLWNCSFTGQETGLCGSSQSVQGTALKQMPWCSLQHVMKLEAKAFVGMFTYHRLVSYTLYSVYVVMTPPPYVTDMLQVFGGASHGDFLVGIRESQIRLVPLTCHMLYTSKSWSIER